MILTVTLNPCIDKTVWIKKMETGRIIRSQRVTYQSGGKGINVSRVLTKLGVENNALTFGGGASGRHLTELLRQEGIQHRIIPIDGMVRTVTTVVEEDTYFQTAYVEPGPHLSEREINRMMDAFGEEAEAAELIVLSGSAPDQEHAWMIPEMIGRGKKMGKKVWLDTRDKAFSIGVEARPYFIKPNLEELEQYIGRKIAGKERLPVLQKLHDQGIAYVILSLGEEGAVMICPEGVYYQEAFPVRVVNAVGSGDSFTAGFLYGYIQGYPPSKCLNLGCRAGAVNASMWEAAFVSSLKIEAYPFGKGQDKDK
ncbi:MAG: 1-phosphofructokinase family hexose kinase [Clostridia bacterium]|jgi:tagatose 6-phosphate kinase